MNLNWSQKTFPGRDQPDARVWPADPGEIAGMGTLA